MKLSCPHCARPLEVSDTSARQQVRCPHCAQAILVPVAAGSKTTPRVHAPPATGARSRSNRPAHPSSQSSGGNGGWIVWLLLCALVGGAWFFRDKLMMSPRKSAPQTATPAPQVVEAPTEPTPIPTIVEMPPPIDAKPEPTVPTRAPAPERNPLEFLLDHKDRWPAQVTLVEPVEFPVVVAGKVAGSAKAPPGTAVKVHEITRENVAVIYNGGGARTPHSATNLLALAKLEMDKPAPLPKATPPLAAPTTTPSLPATIAVAPPVEDSTPLDDVLVSERKGTFVHPGLLHDEEDFKRMRTHKGRTPWEAGYKKLTSNRHAQLNYQPNPVPIVVRGEDAKDGPQNYAALFHDAAAAYACALRWRVSGDRDYAEKSIEILNAWTSTLKGFGHSNDNDLAAGAQGYQFANAAEIMRTYKGWKPEDFARFQKMMLEVFLPPCRDFLQHHNGSKIEHFWPNWDLCSMAAIMSIGVLCDKPSIYREAVTYFKKGGGTGSIRNCVVYIHPDGLGQWHEAARDQGHTMMGIGLMGAICEMAWKQGDDLYGYDNNRFLAGCEFVAKYNLGEEVPFRAYDTRTHGKLTQVSPASRGHLRPVWELVYNHYVKRKGLPAPWTTKMAEKVRPEGGGEGSTSGGYDQLGYGTLTATLGTIPKSPALPPLSTNFGGSAKSTNPPPGVASQKSTAR